MPDLDEIDRGIIAELQIDPRVSYAALGKQLGVSGMTAATRLNRLRSSQVLWCRALPNLRRLGLSTEVFCYIQTDLTAMSQVVDALKASPYVLRVDRVAGEFDLNFHAIFPSEATLGQQVRALQALTGVRRLVVHHVLENVKESDGWPAVFAEESPADEPPYEVAPGGHLPPQFEPKVALAASWLDALVRADAERLRILSTPAVVYTISPPHPAAGVWEGLPAVLEQAERINRAYRRMWYRVLSVAEAHDPHEIVIDAISPVETQRGRVGTAFSRMAFAFADGKVDRATSVGQLEIPDVSTGGPSYPRLAH
jgi:DNA-binding Lrp family transcriptional regulator